MTRAVIERGHLKVDAARAALKLKDDLLADPAMWLCEVVRAAALAAAPSVQIRFDTDDLYVWFDGAPWPADLLSRAASDERGPDALRIRRLATATLAALGDEGACVTLFVRSADAIHTTRIERRSAEYIQSEPSDAVLPIETDWQVFLHLRRARSLRVLGRVLSRARPPDVAMLEGRVADDAARIFVQGKPLQAPPATPLFQLTVADGLVFEGVELSVQLEILSPPASKGGGSMYFYEAGILLASTALSWIGPGWERTFPVRVGLPSLRVVVRALSLPTNVSRSRVRDELVGAIDRSVRAVLPSLIVALKQEVASVADPRRGELIEALTVLAAWAALGPGHGSPDVIVQLLGNALDLPLLRDACGRARDVRGLMDAAGRGEVYVLRGSPLEPLYLPLVRSVFLVSSPNSAAAQLLDALGARAFAEIEQDVEVGVSRRRQALAKPPAPFVSLTRAPIQADLSRPDGLRAIIAVSRGRGASMLRLHVDDQPIETLTAELDGLRCVVEGVVQHPGALVPTIKYDGVERDGAFQSTMVALRAAVYHAIAHAGATEDGAMAGYVRALFADLLQYEPAQRKEEAWSKLGDVPIWPLVSGKRLSCNQLRAVHGNQRGLRFITQEAHNAKDRSRYDGLAPVLVLDEADREVVIRLLRAPGLGEPYLTAYMDWIDKPRTAWSRIGQVLEQYAGVKLGDVRACGSAEETTPYAAVRVGDEGALVRMHRGVVVAVQAQRDFVIVVDEDYLLPKGAPEAPLPPEPPVVRMAREQLFKGDAGLIALPSFTSAEPDPEPIVLPEPPPPSPVVPGYEGEAETTDLLFCAELDEPYAAARVVGQVSARAKGFAKAVEITVNGVQIEPVRAVLGVPATGVIVMSGAADLLVGNVLSPGARAHLVRRLEELGIADLERRGPSGAVGTNARFVSVKEAGVRWIGWLGTSQDGGAAVDVRSALGTVTVSYALATKDARVVGRALGWLLVLGSIGSDRQATRAAAQRFLAQHFATQPPQEPPLQEPPPTPSPPAPPPPKPRKPRPPRPVQLPVSAPAPRDPAPIAVAAPPEPPNSLLRGLLALVGVHEVRDSAHGDPLVRRLAGIFTAANVPAVATFGYSSAGRPVRYQARKARLVINPKHPSIQALVERGDLLSLVAASLAEINRDCESVTDKEECRILMTLLSRAIHATPPL